MYASMDDVNNYARVSGRVYQDIDSNGKYDAGVDKPQSSVKVRIDGARFAETDVNGIFSSKLYRPAITNSRRSALGAPSYFARRRDTDLNLETGQHVQLDFGLPARDASPAVFFERTKTARLTKRHALSDVRIVTSSGRDTLTDGDGFTRSPTLHRRHVIWWTKKPYPKNKAGVERRAMQIFAGRETSEVDLMIVPIQRK